MSKLKGVKNQVMRRCLRESGSNSVVLPEGLQQLVEMILVSREAKEHFERRKILNISKEKEKEKKSSTSMTVAAEDVSVDEDEDEDEDEDATKGETKGETKASAAVVPALVD